MSVRTAKFAALLIEKSEIRNNLRFADKITEWLIILGRDELIEPGCGPEVLTTENVQPALSSD